ncbi:MAG TPA: TatD family hydrolase [Bacillota bacterium]|nr:TatD family hydrolase [Bacillota bacterium]HPF42684.1 TatD family hydrolase [Bacillota bacterium]HPJ86300.1 TatD family hydrolase [Bacillota bacterium]HPQ62206.1 TatD family hydrolase [Bacillota bacterium]HRX91917.1 TatD family hydrolase [Candidatus Izemoplasmatales bacterium]
MFTDSHAHLNDSLLYPEADEVIRRANLAKVTRIICPGYDLESNKKAIELAERYPAVFAAIGFHPENIGPVTDADYEWLKEHCHHEKVVAIGEIGLDYYWDKSLMEKQKDAFIRQIGIAGDNNLPMIIHMRDATADTLNILMKHKKQSAGGVMHCYSGSVESAKDFIGLNMFISLGGPVTFKNAKAAKEVAAIIPLEYLLIETDSPYLAPTPYRGKTNEPAYVVRVAEEIAGIRNMPTETIGLITSKNAEKLFAIAG